VREWLADTGIAVPRGDEAALARAIERLSGDPATWELYAHAARERAERYRLDAHLQLLTNIMAVGAGEGVVR
jgi:glycosyltransferase involved in cell wall biosynthesis